MTNGPEFTADKLKKYPHFFPRDIPIWDRFLDRYSSDYIGFDYDVKVGSGTESPEHYPDNYRRMQEILSKYRVDAVGHRSDAIVIIEVKPEAGTIAFGQIEMYTELYKRDFQPNTNVIGAIVTDRELPDMRELSELRGHEYYIV
jgi:hypothetical protein